MTKRTYISFIVFAFFFMSLTGCGRQAEMPEDGVSKEIMMEDAIAVLHPVGESGVSGLVEFQAVAGGVRVSARVTGLTPGKHGFHIHAFGDCSAPDATSAGGHYNPEGVEHGAPTADLRHMGDLGNLPANAQGTADVDFLDEHLELNGPNSIVGQGVIVHAGTDDF